MPEILFFQHDPLWGPGVFGEVLGKHGCPFRCVRSLDGEEASAEWAEVAGLVFLTGAMGVDDEERYPFLRNEKAIIRAALKLDLPILGVGLGAQLVAAAAGAEIYRGHLLEIGWYPVAVTLEGQLDPLFGYLPESLVVFQWHEHGFELPAGAERLACSNYYRNQAFRIGRRVYGLQFHIDAPPAAIERWLGERWRDLAQVPYVSPEKINADTGSYAQGLRRHAERFFSEFTRRLLLPALQARPAGSRRRPAGAAALHSTGQRGFSR
jgi:GMP synthase (glutamine-hydrolysing)